MIYINKRSNESIVETEGCPSSNESRRGGKKYDRCEHGCNKLRDKYTLCRNHRRNRTGGN